MRVGVTGSHGFIGTALLPRLSAAGHDAVRLPRVPSESELERLDAVVHLAGAGIGDRRWTAGRKRELLESRTLGTAAIAGAVAGLDRPPRVLVSASAVGYYGDRGGTELTEESPPGHDFLASLCQQWEAAAAPAAEAGVRVAFVRSGLVLGRHGGALPRLRRIFRTGLGGRLGSGSQWWSWITIDDEAAALAWLLDHDVSGPVNCTAPAPVTNAQFTRALASCVSRPAVLPVPRFGPQLVLGRELADALLFTSARVLPAVLEREGFPFAHPELESALRAVLA